MRYLLAVVMVLCAATIWAASGDYVAPTANYDEGDWTKTDSIYTSDNKRATSVGTNQHRVGGKSFNIAVDNGATIDSIIVTAEGYANSATASFRNFKVQLSKDGGATGVGDEVQDRWLNGTESVVTIHGSTNNLWGTTWTEAEIESANFTVNVRKATTNAAAHFVDQIKVSVWWTVGAFNGNRRTKIINMGLTKSQ